MKINNIGIQNYQQLNRNDNVSGQRTDRKYETENESQVSIEPQKSVPTSKLAIKAPSGSFADSLTPDERKALDMIFARFKESGRANSESSPETSLGNIIDVKV